MNIKNTTLALTLSVFSFGAFAHHLEEFQTPLNEYLKDSVTYSLYTGNTIENIEIYPGDIEYEAITSMLVPHRQQHLMDVRQGYSLIDENGMVLKVIDAYNIGVYEMIVEENNGPVACNVDEHDRLQLHLHAEVRHSFTVLQTQNTEIVRSGDECVINGKGLIYINNLKFPSQ